ncbi:MAG TPA: hypothetical protein DCY20_09260 [Firmicutes bacterium]|nr:hypothetical protein [Bacillota bacterium]
MDKIGLVLSGGGAKGAYQIGVFRALEELNLKQQIIAVSGASIGTLNEMIFLQYTATEAEQLWKSLNWQKVMHIDEQQYEKLQHIQEAMKKQKISPLATLGNLFSLARTGGFPIRRHMAKVALQRCIDIEGITRANIQLFACCQEVKSGRPYYFQLNGLDESTILDVILASTAIPVIYESVKINGVMFCDPLKSENIPVRVMMNTNCETVIVVHLDYQTQYKGMYQHQGKTFIHIVPSQNIGRLLTGSLDFSEDAIQRNIELGYEDGYRILSELLSNQIYYTPKKMKTIQKTEQTANLSRLY